MPSEYPSRLNSKPTEIKIFDALCVRGPREGIVHGGVLVLGCVTLNRSVPGAQKMTDYWKQKVRGGNRTQQVKKLDSNAIRYTI